LCKNTLWIDLGKQRVLRQNFKAWKETEFKIWPFQVDKNSNFEELFEELKLEIKSLKNL
jgi:hypothetical protein